MTTEIHITDIESAINYLRKRDGNELVLGAELSALAELYAEMVYHGETSVKEDEITPHAMEAWMQWYITTPDAPCIAICSTAQGDAMCKGCGRTFDEVQHWPGLTPAEKRVIWRRITIEGDSWRFNKYKERAPELRDESEQGKMFS